MSLQYRVVWRDDRPGLLDAVHETFASWLRSKKIDAQLPVDGRVDGRVAEDPVEVIVRRATAGGVSASRHRLIEERAQVGQRWVTTVTALVGGDEQWLWADLEWVADDPTERIEVAAPRFVGELIESGVDARVDQVRLTSKPGFVDPPGLAGLIRNQERSLPLVVFSYEAGDRHRTEERAAAAARRLVGAVQVFLLRPGDEDEFKALVGDDLGVWGGAARLYLPNSGPYGLRPERHRYIPIHKMATDKNRPVRLLLPYLSQAMTARREPPIFEPVRRQLSIHIEGEILSLADEEIAERDARISELSKEIDELKKQIDNLGNELFDTQVDYEEAVNGMIRAQDNFLLSLASARGDIDQQEESEHLAFEPRSIAEAIDHARKSLDGIVIHANAERDIDELDAEVTSGAWATQTWRGLRALHLYASADFDGDFKAWCERSGHQLAWGANDKHLAMRESESVMNKPQHRKQRDLPVDTRVARAVDGLISMEAHLKIATGGGPKAPRVYFHDDTRGITGKIHVGFIGPHHYMENTRTN